MEPIDLLRRIVSIDSVFPRERELAFFLARELERAGFNVEMQRFGEDGGRYNVLATRSPDSCEPKKSPILLYGHMDTVPPYGYEKIGRDPFVLQEHDGKLYGLGAYDMKAGIAAILSAVDAVRADRPLKVMFVSDEEADSRGTYEAGKAGFLKGCRFALATEISDVSDMAQSANTITLGRRGRVQYEVTVPGTSSHAATLDKGVSAITQAASIAIGIERMNGSLPVHPKLGQGNQFVRSFRSVSVSLSVPDEATLLIDRHLVPPENAKSAMMDLESKINMMYDAGQAKEGNGARAKIAIRPREVPYLMPYATPAENPEVRVLSRVIEERLHSQARYNYGLSVADENLIAMHGVPVASLGPIGGGEHSHQEWVSKKSYLELIDVLKSFLDRM